MELPDPRESLYLNRHFEQLRDQLKARSIDETVKALLKSHKRRILSGAFGADKGRVKRFSEGDRGEDR